MALIQYLRSPTTVSFKGISLKTQELLLITNAFFCCSTFLDNESGGGLDELLLILQVVLCSYTVHLLQQRSNANSSLIYNSKYGALFLAISFFVALAFKEATAAASLLTESSQIVTVSQGFALTFSVMKNLALVPQLCVLHKDCFQASPMEGYLTILLVSNPLSFVFGCFQFKLLEYGYDLGADGSQSEILCANFFLFVPLALTAWILRGTKHG